MNVRFYVSLCLCVRVHVKRIVDAFEDTLPFSGSPCITLFGAILTIIIFFISLICFFRLHMYTAAVVSCIFKSFLINECPAFLFADAQ